MNDKIAIIDALGAHGSSHNLYLYGQASGLSQSGLRVSIYTNNITSNPNYNGVKFFQFYRNIFNQKSKVISGIKYIFGSMISIFHAKFSGVRICHYHIFHINILVLFDFILTKILAMKVVYTVHDVLSFEEKESSYRLKNWIYKRTDKILTHNQFSAETFKQQYGALKSDIEIVPHGNYLPFLNIIKDKNFARKNIGVPTGKKVLLFFGMIKKVKGLEILLKSLKEVKEKHPDILLVIAGKVWQDDFSVYQKIINQHRLKEYCVIHNKFIDHRDINSYYAAADLVVLPYKRIYQSGVLMMSMSYERAVLVSDLPPLTDIVTDKETGFIFKSEDPQSLATKLNDILSNLDILDTVRYNGVKLIKTKYDWKHIGMQTKRVYQSIS